MTCVLIAVDDTPDSVRAAQTARELFGADAHYILINVGPLPMTGWVGTDGVMAPMAMAPWPVATMPVGEGAGTAAIAARPLGGAVPAAAAAAEETATKVGEEAGLLRAGEGADTIGDVGFPADAVLAAAHDQHADVVVVGSHHRSWIRRVLSPSIGTALVKAADVPVLVVD